MVINDVVAAGIIIIGVLDPKIVQKVYMKYTRIFYTKNIQRKKSMTHRPVKTIWDTS